MKGYSFGKKEAVLAAALDEFSSFPYEQASLNLIIKKAGISKGTFYYHFRDKQDLYLFLLETAVTKKWEYISERLKRMEEVQMNHSDIFELFKIQATLAVEFAQKYPKYQKMGQMFAREKGNVIYDAAKNAIGFQGENILEDIVRNAIKKGDFDQCFTEDFVVKLIRFLFVHFDEIFETSDVSINELEQTMTNLDQFIYFLKNGLGK